MEQRKPSKRRHRKSKYPMPGAIVVCGLSYTLDELKAETSSQYGSAEPHAYLLVGFQLKDES